MATQQSVAFFSVYVMMSLGTFLSESRDAINRAVTWGCLLNNFCFMTQTVRKQYTKPRLVDKSIGLYTFMYVVISFIIIYLPAV